MKTLKLTKLETVALNMLQLQYNLLFNEIDEDLARLHAAAEMIMRNTPLLARHVKSVLAKATDDRGYIANIVQFGFRWS